VRPLAGAAMRKPSGSRTCAGNCSGVSAGARAGPRQLALLRAKLETARLGAQRLFEHFWTYNLETRRRVPGLLDWRALRSRIEPMKKVAECCAP